MALEQVKRVIAPLPVIIKFMTNAMIALCTLFFQIKRQRILMAFLLISFNLPAQENIRFERISVNEGLSQSDVRCFAQDNFGFLWIGTRDGLNKYDGVEFKKYNRLENDSTSLYFNQIFDLEVDATGDVWIASSGGISVYDYANDKFENFFPDRDLHNIDIYHILLTGKSSALLSTNKGLISFDRKRKKFFTDANYSMFAGLTVLQARHTNAHGLWVATSKGVFVKSTEPRQWIRLLEDNAIYDIEFDRNLVYLGASNGLFRYDLQEKRIASIPMQFGGAVTDIMRIKNGDLWVASNKVIVLDKNDAFKYLLEHDQSNTYSLSEDRARILFQTADNVIWVGTFGYGLNKFNPDVAKFSYLSEYTRLPLSGNYVSTVFTPDDTTLWVGTSRGLDVIDLVTGSAKHFSSNNDLFQILKIKMDRQNNIWISTSRGLHLYSGGKLILKNDEIRSVYDFAEWDDTHLVLASRVQGIFLLDKKSGKVTEFISASALREEVSCVRVEDDHVWVGCKDGLKLFDRTGKLARLSNADDHSLESLRSSFIKSIYRDTRNNLWIGTWGGGLSKLNISDSSFTTYTVNNGLPNNVIYGMLEDRSGTLWLSTNLGLSAFNPDDTSINNFDFFDGLQSNEFNTGAYFKSAGGKFYFGGVNGLSYFDPNDLLTPEPIPAILKTSITVNNKALNFQESDSTKNVLLTHRIKTSWKENDIRVAFTNIDFKQARKYIFQYSMKDTTWYDIGNRRSLELIDLPSGNHEIAVRARKPGSEWSPGVVLLSIEVVPPLWQRTWFRIVAVLAFLSLVFGIYRYRIARLRTINAMLNTLVEQRTTEITAKNEEIGSQNDQLHELNRELEAFSYSVSHDLRAPLRSVIGYSQILQENHQDQLGDEGNRLLRIIHHNSVRMNNLINDLLEFSKVSRLGLQKSEIEMDEFLKKILEEVNQSLLHKAEINVAPLPAVIADRKLLSQVWINLISNAIKYSAKKTKPVVEIGFQPGEKEDVFYVKDNGAGFDMTYADRLFGVFQRLHKVNEFEGTGVGLAIVHRIVTKHGGRVWAEGKVNEGAIFYFSLPKK